MKGEWMEALRLRVLEEGAFRAAFVPVADIRFDRAFRDMCATNACGNYGRCWMCPPDVGGIDEMMAEAQSYDFALVYQTVDPLEDSFDFEGMMDAAARSSRLSQKLTGILREGSFPRWLQLGAGGCHVCQVCAKRTNEPCRHPDLALASLETYGADVSKLAEAAGMKYINGQNTVTFFGAVLFRKGE